MQKTPHIVVIVQARMGATRFPGKPLKKVLDKSLLSYLIERLRQSETIDQIVIATTTNPLDDAIVEECVKEKIDYFRGSEANVLERYYQTAKYFHADIIVRITADCPLMDPHILDHVVKFYLQHYPLYRYVSNTLKLSYPRGMDVEVFSFSDLKLAWDNATQPEELEHVTPYFYRHPEMFSLGNVELLNSQADYRWTVDTEEDFKLVSHLITALYPTNPRFALNDLLQQFVLHPEWKEINAIVKQKALKDEQLFIGVDLGGTKIDIGLVDLAGKIRVHEIIKTRVEDGPDAIVNDIAAVIKKIEANTKNLKINAIGIGMAGQIEKETGLVFFAPNLRWINYPLQEKLQTITNIPVVVTNDVRAATWGEWLYGAGKGCNDIVCLFVGTGIGGGIVSGGKMLSGASNTAGELGHITVELNGPLCSCGNHGCLESLAGGSSIGKRAQELIQKKPKEGQLLLKLANNDLKFVQAQVVFEGFKQDDPLAIEIINTMHDALIAGVASILNAFNPKRLILGGGVIQRNPEFLEIVRRRIAERALKAPTEIVEIVGTVLESQAGVVGAAAFALNCFKKEDNDDN